MSLALEGIKIVDLTRVHAGPFATALLADMGAEVIKVEEPEGEQGRRSQTLTGAPAKLSPFFEFANRNKKSLAIDLKKPQGKEVIYRLVKGADVFYHNFRPGVPERLGLGYDTLSQINPRLVYVSASGFGEKGPLWNRPGYDPCAQALSGLMTCSGLPEWRYVPVGVPLVDMATGMMGAYGTMLALFAREKTGRGQKVEVSLLGSALALQWWLISEYLFTGQVTPRYGRGKVWGTSARGCYRCQDGGYLVLAAGREQREALFKVLGLDLSADPRFDTEEKVNQNQEELLKIMDNIFLSRPLAEWLKLLEEADVPHAPVLNYAEAANHPQVIANEYIVETVHPEAGPVRVPGISVKLSHTPGQIRTPAPKLGEHTEEILRSAGYTPEEIAALLEQKVVFTGPGTPATGETVP